MATVIKPKRSETALAVPTAGSLEVGELALNVTDGKFYTKTSGNTVKEVLGIFVLINILIFSLLSLSITYSQFSLIFLVLYVVLIFYLFFKFANMDVLD